MDGDRIIGPDGKPLELRGMSFGNRVWLDDRLPRTHHDERDYARLAALGLNAVRFYVNYRTLETDDAPGKWLADGLQWLDDNVAWAKKHGVYLILNQHVPPGGFIAMAPPLKDGLVTFDDGTKSTLDQQAKDVSAFLMWAAEPKLEERKQTGFAVLIYLLLLSGLLYASYKTVWRNESH